MLDSENEENVKHEDKETFKEMFLLLRYHRIFLTLSVIMFFSNWVFMMFAISNFLTSLGYPIPYTFIPVIFLLSSFNYQTKFSTNNCQAQPKPQLKLSWAEFSIILTKSTT